MNTVPLRPASGEGCTQVSLGELIGLRLRVSRPMLRTVASSALRAGSQRSRAYGRGMDYAESRMYQAGDDVRRLDWRLTARSGKLHTKLFQEEREGRMLILLDQHPSMRFGTRSRFKSVQAARVAALAAWYATAANERVGLMSFGSKSKLLRPRAGVRGALALCAMLAAAEELSDVEQSLSQTIQRVRHLQRDVSRVLLISDGWHCDEDAHASLLDLTRHATVYVMVIADALELLPPVAGAYPFEHAGDVYHMNLTRDHDRQSFQAKLGAGSMRLQKMARSLMLPLQVMDTVVDPVDPVVRLLRSRWRGG